MANPAVFDGVANRYDGDFSDTPTGVLQRERVHFLLGNYLHKHSAQVLELNCGTGVDAVWLASAGHSVLATDISGEMVAQTADRADHNGFSGQIQTAVAGFEAVKAAVEERRFDLIFSNFGGLNCMDAAQLRAVSADFAAVLGTKGVFVAVIMPRGCIWERFYYLVKGKFGEAFRRRRKGAVQAPLQDGSFQPTWYYSPNEFAGLFSDHFRLLGKFPVGIALPPSYLDPFFVKRPGLLARLNRWEKRLCRSWLANGGDHCMVVLEKM